MYTYGVPSIDVRPHGESDGKIMQSSFDNERWYHQRDVRNTSTGSRRSIECMINHALLF